MHLLLLFSRKNKNGCSNNSRQSLSRVHNSTIVFLQCMRTGALNRVGNCWQSGMGSDGVDGSQTPQDFHP